MRRRCQRICIAEENFLNHVQRVPRRKNNTYSSSNRERNIILRGYRTENSIEHEKFSGKCIRQRKCNICEGHYYKKSCKSGCFLCKSAQLRHFSCAELLFDGIHYNPQSDDV